MQKPLDIERLLIWTYRDELPKQEANPIGRWHPLAQLSMLGTRIAASQLEARLPVILGEPHPDAREIAKRTSELPRPMAALCSIHATLGMRPNWLPGPIVVSAYREGSKVRIVGECKGKNRYTTGSYCPLRWSPTPELIRDARLEYSQWHAGLVELARTLVLRDHQALPPRAPPQPWLRDEPLPPVLISLLTA